jgi:hypothetical protein
MQQVGGYLGYSGRDADAFGMTARDSEPTFATGAITSPNCLKPAESRTEAWKLMPVRRGRLRRGANEKAHAWQCLGVYFNPYKATGERPIESLGGPTGIAVAGPS